MNDALEILDEIQNLIFKANNDSDALDQVSVYIVNKRQEFAEPRGDCCGWNEDRIDVVGQNGNTGDHY